MLEELRSYSNLGTPNFFWELMNALQSSKYPWTKNSINKLFFNRWIEGKNKFDGCIDLAIFIKIIDCDNDGALKISSDFLPHIHDKNIFEEKFVEYLFSALRHDRICFDIFSSSNISVDLIYQSTRITNKAFGLNYTNFKQLLLDFGVLESHTTEVSNFYLITKVYSSLFQNLLLIEIKKQIMSPEQLKLLQEAKEAHGLEAELFVMEYEKKRLASKLGILRVAEYSVSEGYDIASFHTQESMLHDRFIEVKSYTGKLPSFYWSRNEIETAKVKGRKYYLYLVNREMFKNPQYEPLILQNPYLSVLNKNNWNKQVETLFISHVC